MHQMNSYSLSFEVMQFVLQNNNKYPSDVVLNGHWNSKVSTNVEYEEVIPLK